MCPKSLRKYRRGVRLYRFCSDILRDTMEDVVLSFEEDRDETRTRRFHDRLADQLQEFLEIKDSCQEPARLPKCFLIVCATAVDIFIQSSARHITHDWREKSDDH